MTTVKEIENAVEHLPPKDLNQFRNWFEAFESATWDRQLETDARNERPNALVNEAQAEYKAGKNSDRLILEALGLPLRLRAFEAEKLIESLDAAPTDGLSPAWRSEIRKRSREIEDGTAALRDAEEVFKNAYAALK